MAISRIIAQEHGVIKMKIFLGCPTAKIKSYALTYYAEGIKKLTFKNIQILLADNSSDDSYIAEIREQGLPVIKTPWHPTARASIVTSRNILREHFLKSDCTHFFSLEQDVIPAPNVIEKLLFHNVPIISGVYLNMYKTPHGLMKLPVLWGAVTKAEFDAKKDDSTFQEYLEKEDITDESDMMRKLNFSEVKGSHLLPVMACGLGCVLIAREVVEKVPFRYEPDRICFDDMFFCKDSKNHGYTILCDTAVKCRHIISGDQWENITK